MIYLTSDLHFMHDKDFLYEPRGFNSIYEMNEQVVSNINEVVKPDDELYILGDIMLNNNDIGIKMLKDIACHNIHIILGNHDSKVRVGLYKNCWNVVEVAAAAYLTHKKYNFFLSHYPTLCSNYDDADKPLKKRMISLCGHSHTQDKFADMDKGIIYHVELDAHNNYPVSIDTIIEDIKNYKEM